MANATAITVRDLAVNGAVAAATADVLDTGTAAVTVKAAVADGMRRCILLAENTDNDTAMTVKISAGTNPPAFRAGAVGDLSLSVAFGTVGVLGPFESARFMQSDGTLSVTVTPASGTIAAKLTLYRLPRGV